jgi:hypothetical protein
VHELPICPDFPGAVMTHTCFLGVIIYSTLFLCTEHCIILWRNVLNF